MVINKKSTYLFKNIYLSVLFNFSNYLPPLKHTHYIAIRTDPNIIKIVPIILFFVIFSPKANLDIIIVHI